MLRKQSCIFRARAKWVSQYFPAFFPLHMIASLFWRKPKIQNYIFLSTYNSYCNDAGPFMSLRLAGSMSLMTSGLKKGVRKL